MIQFTKDMKTQNRDSLQEIVDSFNNDVTISDALYTMQENLKNKAEEKGLTCV
jgi:4-phosphopantoate--beta-alanine ligase